EFLIRIGCIRGLIGELAHDKLIPVIDLEDKWHIRFVAMPAKSEILGRKGAQFAGREQFDSSPEEDSIPDPCNRYKKDHREYDLLPVRERFGKGCLFGYVELWLDRLFLIRLQHRIVPSALKDYHEE